MFVLGSAIAGGRGRDLRARKGFANARQFGIDLGLGIFVMLILGGIDSRWGPVVGAAFYVFVPQWLQGGVLGISGIELTVDVFGQEHRLGDFREIFFGSLLVVTMIAFPEGWSASADCCSRSRSAACSRPTPHVAQRPPRHHAPHEAQATTMRSPTPPDSAAGARRPTLGDADPRSHDGAAAR